MSSYSPSLLWKFVLYLENPKELPTRLASLNNLKCLDIRYSLGLEGLTSLTELFVEHDKMFTRGIAEPNKSHNFFW